MTTKFHKAQNQNDEQTYALIMNRMSVVPVLCPLLRPGLFLREIGRELDFEQSRNIIFTPVINLQSDTVYCL